MILLTASVKLVFDNVLDARLDEDFDQFFEVLGIVCLLCRGGPAWRLTREFPAIHRRGMAL